MENIPNFKDLLDSINLREEICKMQWKCFGDYCYILDGIYEGKEISIYFDILTQDVYMVSIYEDENLKSWVDPFYYDAYKSEGIKFGDLETFVLFNEIFLH